MAKGKSNASKAAWDKARKLAERDGITVKEARSVLAKNPSALEEGKPTTPKTEKPKKSAPESPKAKSGTRKKAPIDLAKAEAELRKKYPHIVPGTLKAASKDGTHPNRRTIEIECTADGCKNRRTIATSDLFQVKLCVDCKQKSRSKKKPTKKSNSDDPGKTAATKS